ncbi:hypothetical protein GCM10027062_14630 [Nocardioides hungaricus]
MISDALVTRLALPNRISWLTPTEAALVTSPGTPMTGRCRAGPVRGGEGAAPGGALDNHGAFGQRGHEPGSGEQPVAGGRVAGWRFGDDEAAFGDRLK